MTVYCRIVPDAVVPAVIRLLGKNGIFGRYWIATLMLTVLPGVLLGDHVVVTVAPPAGAPQSNGLTILEMSVAVQL